MGRSNSPAPRSNPYFAEHERRQSVFYEQIHHLRGQLRKISPKGRKARVSIVDQAERGIDSPSPQIKERVQKIISELNNLTADHQVENLRHIGFLK